MAKAPSQPLHQTSKSRTVVLNRVQRSNIAGLIAAALRHAGTAESEPKEEIASGKGLDPEVQEAVTEVMRLKIGP